MARVRAPLSSTSGQAAPARLRSRLGALPLWRNQAGGETVGCRSRLVQKEKRDEHLWKDHGRDLRRCGRRSNIIPRLAVKLLQRKRAVSETVFGLQGAEELLDTCERALKILEDDLDQLLAERISD